MGEDRRVEIDDERLNDLLEESNDLHADAMTGIRSTYPALREIGAERRAALARLGRGAAALTARTLTYGGLGSLFAGLAAGPARADLALDVQILQTASGLEQLAVDTYSTVLTGNPAGLGDLPGAAGQVVRTLATTTMAQHEEHKRAFQTQTRLLGGPEQTAPNPKFQLIVDFRLARARTPADVLEFAALLEKVATDTYLVNLTMLEDPRTKEIMAGVMGVEAQHASSLRTVSSLLEGDAAQLVKIPVGTDLANLPRDVGRVAFPDALHAVGNAELIAQPETGAVG